MSLQAIPGLDAAQFQVHALHGPNQDWVQTNCYLDVWISVLHALGLEPAPALLSTLTLDFDGDQWTFSKPSFYDLEHFYGLEVQELNVWRNLLDNSIEQLGMGRLVLSEIDSYYLPDTQATDYRQNHVKTTIAIQSIDLAWHKLTYFHNGGLHTLKEEDFDELFRLHKKVDPQFMPFFAEFVRLDGIEILSPDALRARAHERIRYYLSKAIQRQQKRDAFSGSEGQVGFNGAFAQELVQIAEHGMPHYHAWAFANLRQLGCSSSLSAYVLNWYIDAAAHEQESHPLRLAALEFQKISQTCKMAMLKTARFAANRKPTDFSPLLAELQQTRQRALAFCEQFLNE